VEYRKGNRAFALLNLVTTTAEEAILLIILLVILPKLGINAHSGIIIALPVAWAAWSYLTYRIGARAIIKMPVVGAEALVGLRCRTTAPLSPEGYVKVGSELWQAYSIDGDISPEDDIIVVEVKGLTLLVKKTSGSCIDVHTCSEVIKNKSGNPEI
jgi:membrane-bound ClpP family serine protease